MRTYLYELFPNHEDRLSKKNGGSAGLDLAHYGLQELAIRRLRRAGRRSIGRICLPTRRFRSGGFLGIRHLEVFGRKGCKRGSTNEFRLYLLRDLLGLIDGV